MNKKLHTSLAALLMSALIFSGCKKDDDPIIAPPVHRSLFYIVNEGSMGSGEGSISLYDGRDTANVRIVEDLFFEVNNRQLGDIVQSLAFHNGKGFIAVNNSGKVEVVNESTFASVATIQLASPRFFTGVSATKGYITDWNSESVQIVDLASNAITGSIPAGKGPEKMLISGNRVYVSNVGGLTTDNTLTVIDANTDAVVETITVNPMPNSMHKDRNGKLWVICGGKYDDWNTPSVDESEGGALVRVDLNLNVKELELNMPNSSDHPQTLAISPAGDFVYYSLFDKIYRMDVNATTLPTVPFAEVPGAYLYGLSVDPATGDVLATVGSFTTNGEMHIFSPTGQARQTIPTGRGTNNVIAR